jgi:hypothetical protein
MVSLLACSSKGIAVACLLVIMTLCQHHSLVAAQSNHSHSYYTISQSTLLHIIDDSTPLTCVPLNVNGGYCSDYVNYLVPSDVNQTIAVAFVQENEYDTTPPTFLLHIYLWSYLPLSFIHYYHHPVIQ